MSFMKGFGDGFERAFQAGIERKERRRDDTFKLMYEDFLKNRETDATRKKEDRKAVDKAKALVDGLDLPEGAWVNAYQWVQAGLDDKEIVERLSTGTFSPSELPAGETNTPTPAEQQTRQAMAPTNTESLEAPESAPQAPQPPRPSQPVGPTQAAAQPPQATQAQAQAPQRRNPLAGLLTKPGLFDRKPEPKKGENKRMNRDLEYGINRIAEVTGLSPEEVRKTYERTPDEPLVDTSKALKFTAAPPKRELPSLEEAIFKLENARSESELELAQAEVNAIQQAMKIEQMFRGRADTQGNVVTLRVQKPDGAVDYVPARPNMDGGYTPINPNQAIDGQIAGVVDDQEQEWLWELAKDSLDKPAMEYKGKQSALISMYRSGGEMASLVEKFPKLQQDTTTSLVSGAQRVLSELIAGREVLRDIPFFKNGGGKSVEQVLETVGKGGQISPEDAKGLTALEAELASYIGQNNNDLSAAKLLFDTRAALMAYHIGASVNQTGRDLAEPERQRFLELARGGISPQKFMENMGGLLAGIRRDLEQQSANLRDYNQKVNLFEQRYQYRPFEVVPSMEEVMAKASTDPMIAKGIEAFERYDPLNSPLFNNKPTTQPQEPVAQEQPQAQPASQPAGQVKPVGTDPKTGKTVYQDENGNLFTE